MSQSQVKGELFLRALDAVALRWGRNGLDVIGYDPASYVAERWYEISEFCDLLASVKTRLGSNNPISVYQLGFRTMKDDERWQDVFDDQDPALVFLTSERQESMYKVGAVCASTLGQKQVRVDLNANNTDPLWFEFYRGQLQGVLELTGRTGVVHLLPASRDSATRTYDIKWG